MIETKSAFISKIDEQTIKIIFKPQARLDIEEYELFYDHYKATLGDAPKMKFLILVQEGFKLEKKILKFFKNVFRTDFKKAEAYVILHPPTRMFFKVGLQTIKHEYPVKLFESEKEALDWLKTIT